MQTQSQFVRELLNPGDTFVDLGAKSGIGTALVAARIVGDAGTVIAVEPDGDFFGRLSFNVAQAAFKNVYCVKSAVCRVDHLSAALKFPHVDLVRVDCPGMELEVTSGLAELITGLRPPSVIFVWERADADRTGQRVEDLFSVADYEVRWSGYTMIARSPNQCAEHKAPGPRGFSSVFIFDRLRRQNHDGARNV
jgi:hypothetical protein